MYAPVPDAGGADMGPMVQPHTSHMSHTHTGARGPDTLAFLILDRGKIHPLVGKWQ